MLTHIQTHTHACTHTRVRTPTHTHTHGVSYWFNRVMYGYRYREEIHPHATLPALMLEDGSTLLESSAICLYLAEVFSDANTVNMLPQGDKETSAYYKYAICVLINSIGNQLHALRKLQCVKEIIG